MNVIEDLVYTKACERWANCMPRPMELAPKDGSWIAGWCMYHMGAEYRKVRWENNEWNSIYRIPQNVHHWIPVNTLPSIGECL